MSDERNTRATTDQRFADDSPECPNCGYDLRAVTPAQQVAARGVGGVSADAAEVPATWGPSQRPRQVRCPECGAEYEFEELVSGGAWLRRARWSLLWPWRRVPQSAGDILTRPEITRPAARVTESSATQFFFHQQLTALNWQAKFLPNVEILNPLPAARRTTGRSRKAKWP